MNMFEEATRKKLRFNSTMGQISVEDVWDLPLTSRTKFSLDSLAKQLNREIKDQEEESFVVKQSSANSALKLRFDIVKHIIDIRMAEAEEKAKAVEKKAQKEKILGILAKKEEESLENMGEEDLKKMLENL